MPGRTVSSTSSTHLQHESNTRERASPGFQTSNACTPQRWVFLILQRTSTQCPQFRRLRARQLGMSGIPLNAAYHVRSPLYSGRSNLEQRKNGAQRRGMDQLRSSNAVMAHRTEQSKLPENVRFDLPDLNI